MHEKALRPPYRLALVDDHKFVVHLLAERLDSDPALQVVGVVHDSASALELVYRTPVDIVLLDIKLDNENGLVLLQKFIEIAPHLRTICLSMYDNNEIPATAITYGARGYISKTATDPEIVSAIKRVAAGKPAFSTKVARYLSIGGKIRGVENLTNREIEILTKLAAGNSIEDIAAGNGISVKTVLSHRNNARRKMNVTNDMELCIKVIRAGIIDPL